MLRMTQQPLYMLIIPLIIVDLLYLLLILSTNDYAHLMMSLLFIGAAFLLVEEKLPSLPQTLASWWERAFGMVVLGFVTLSCVLLWLSPPPATYGHATDGHLMRLLPAVGFVGAVIFAHGMRGVTYFWQGALLLLFLGGPNIVILAADAPNWLPFWISKEVGFWLWYIGFEVQVQSTVISLPGGAVEITPSCAGTDFYGYLLGTAVLALVMFPLPRKTLLVIAVALLIAHVSNIMRIALEFRQPLRLL